jgi:hypothetical protein
MEKIPQEAKDTFHKAYGEAMAAWASLERELGTLFCFCLRHSARYGYASLLFGSQF